MANLYNLGQAPSQHYHDSAFYPRPSGSPEVKRSSKPKPKNKSKNKNKNKTKDQASGWGFLVEAHQWAYQLMLIELKIAAKALLNSMTREESDDTLDEGLTTEQLTQRSYSSIMHGVPIESKP
ncbi:hypothetical protein NW762_000816 [Fusarium torreyae]|uniref:Uncharacterized protein n=1 Tax=Fusarium torreyae TaxID=1237075 RepID=A0A9W8VNF0_9HYPO|nr:hypothetical protein NW762_000816 [Fusarium torreyae]